jgi:hypothetical protein
MNSHRNPDLVIQAFLEEGPQDLPDRTFDAVRSDIHRTRQRVAIGPWREPTVAMISRLAIAAVVVIAAGVAWTNFAPSRGIGGPMPTPAPTASPQLITGDNSSLTPGRYFFDYGLVPGSSQARGPKILLTVPGSGWTNFGNFAIDKNYGATAAEAGVSFVVWNITNRYIDPCVGRPPASPAPASPAPAGDIDSLLTALADQVGIQAGPLTDASIDGYTGKFVDLTVTADISACPGGFYTWGSEEDGRYAQVTNEVDRVYALDVNGTRLTFFMRIPPQTTAQDRALLDAILASIDIQP